MTKLTLSQIIDIVDGTLYGNGDLTISSIAPLDKAKSGQLTFLTNEKYRQHLAETTATAVLIKASELELCDANAQTNAIVVADPYVAYALVAQALDNAPQAAEGIANSAVIAVDAVLGANVNIAANAVIESGVVLGDNVQIGAGCFIGKNTRIGANTKLWANVSVYHGVEMGSDCLVQSNTVIGSDGFGYANQRGEWIKIPQVGGVVIGNRVEIGSCTVIDRGTLDNTVIEDNVILDNHIQIAHNVHIGYGTAMAGSSTIAGSTSIGKYCIIGGAAVINGHITITDGVTITGMAMVMKSITEKGTYSSGIPLQSNSEWRRTAARTLKIDEMYKRLRALEKQTKQD